MLDCASSIAQQYTQNLPRGVYLRHVSYRIISPRKFCSFNSGVVDGGVHSDKILPLRSRATTILSGIDMGHARDGLFRRIKGFSCIECTEVVSQGVKPRSPIRM